MPSPLPATLTKPGTQEENLSRKLFLVPRNMRGAQVSGYGEAAELKLMLVGSNGCVQV